MPTLLTIIPAIYCRYKKRLICSARIGLEQLHQQRKQMKTKRTVDQIKKLIEDKITKVMLVKPEDQERLGMCWVYPTKLPKRLYPKLSLFGKQNYAHRTSYIVFKGHIPAGMLCLHECNQRHCVNPDHLSIGDHDKNMSDKVKDGTSKNKTSEYAFYRKVVSKLTKDHPLWKELEALDLTERERRVLNLTRAGYNSSDIAEKIGNRHRSAISHVWNGYHTYGEISAMGIYPKYLKSKKGE